MEMDLGHIWAQMSIAVKGKSEALSVCQVINPDD